MTLPPGTRITSGPAGSPCNLARVSVHPIQYLLVGSAMCVFYLLELSLSEHLGFGVAYLIATAAIVGQITAYCAAVLRTWPRALAVGGMTAALFGYLYVVLTNEDYALLIGSLGVFALLALIMRLTRRVDWWGTSTGKNPVPWLDYGQEIPIRNRK